LHILVNSGSEASLYEDKQTNFQPFLASSNNRPTLSHVLTPLQICPNQAPMNPKQWRRASLPLALIGGSLTLAGFLPPKGLRQEPARPTREFTIFDVPIIDAQQSAVYSRSAALIGEKKYEECEKMLRKWGHNFPQDPGVPYDIACIRALGGKKDQAFHFLEEAIRLGFTNVDHIKNDDDLAILRDDTKFGELLDLAAKSPPGKPLVELPKPVPAKSKDGKTTVGKENLGFDSRFQVFACLLDKQNAGKGQAITRRKDGLGKLLEQWYKEGKASGNEGDYYDNHDNDHSNMRFGDFPQLTCIEFAQEMKDRQLHYGLQNHLVYNAVVLGNSSTAHTNTSQWRSQARHALTIPGGASLLALHYRTNHLYFYPEHKDHDPGHNREGEGGYGDVFPANTPYLVISQGSSGSDRPFMDAFTATLASFQPNVKKELVEKGKLMPTLQMVFRLSNKNLGSSEDYLTGKAHPTVFDSKDLAPEAMARLANSLGNCDIPPVPVLQVSEETEDLPGQDYFDVGPRQRIFDSPQSICRFHRTFKQDYHVTLQALSTEYEPDTDELEYKWILLRGDCSKVRIESPDAQNTKITIGWHPRFEAVQSGGIESNRVDIGLFIKKKGASYWSTPAFFSITHPDNQERKYSPDGKVISIQYSPENYTDPRIDTPADWLDTYHYDGKTRQMTGWTRKHKNGEEEEFTPDGELALEKDAGGKVVKSMPVSYIHEDQGNGKFIIRQQNKEAD
jgi:hypothetical protein